MSNMSSQVLKKDQKMKNLYSHFSFLSPGTIDADIRDALQSNTEGVGNIGWSRHTEQSSGAYECAAILEWKPRTENGGRVEFITCDDH